MDQMVVMRIEHIESRATIQFDVANSSTKNDMHSCATRLIIHKIQHFQYKIHPFQYKIHPCQYKIHFFRVFNLT